MRNIIIKICIVFSIVLVGVFTMCNSFVNADTIDTQSTVDTTIIQTDDGNNAQSSTDSTIIPSLRSATSTYTYYVSKAKTDGSYENVKSYTVFNDALSYMKSSSDMDYVVRKNSKVVAMKRGMMVLMNSGNVTTLTNLTANTYGTSSSSSYNVSVRAYVPAFYYGTYTSTTDTIYVKGAISGVYFKVDVSKMLLIPDAHMQYRGTGSQDDKKFNMDYYYVNSNSDLVHYLYYANSAGTSMSTKSFIVDKAPSFMVSGKKYYSCDGVKFYTNYYDAAFLNTASYAGTYYPYYKYLSFRTTTNYTASELNKYIKEACGTSSALYNTGSTFIKAQDTYGANAILELAFAILESGYGKSDYALERYNLFGIEAYDSDPDNAKDFSSPSSCILYHAKKYINEGYADAYAYIDSSKPTSYYDVSDRSKGYISSYSGDWRYMGVYPGNKAGGVNFCYATDPYHGEKIGGLAYQIDKSLGLKDYGVYTIALTTKATYGYSKAATSSWKLYKYSGRNYRADIVTSMAVAVLGESGSYYKVQSEMPVNSDLLSCMTWSYNHQTSIAYIPKSALKIVRTASQQLLDYEGAEELMGIVQNLNKTLYTDATVSVLNAKYNTLVSLMSGSATTQTQLDNAVIALREAYGALVAKPASIKVSSITLTNGDTMTVTSIEPFVIKYTVLPENATIKQVRFTSSNPLVASVALDGTVTPRSNGTVKITFSAMDDSKESAVLTLTINTASVTSSTYKVDVSNSVLGAIPTGTDITSIISKVTPPSNMHFTIENNDYTSLTSGRAATGLHLRLYNANDDLIQDLSLSVTGDVNGDAYANISDLIVLKSTLLEKNVLEGANKVSADLNGDGNITIVDFTMLKTFILNQ